MSEANVDVVVFDLGGVLVDWDPRYLYAKLIPDEAERERFLSEVCNMEWNHRLDRGIPFSTAVKAKQSEHPDWAEHIAAYHERWPEMLGDAIEGSVQILEELQAKDVRLFALTNWSAETFPFAEAKYPFLSVFEDIVVSGQERMAKPEIDFYCLLTDRHGLDASRCLFIDDREKNVQAARLAGMQAVTFTTPEALRKDLKAKSVL